MLRSATVDITVAMTLRFPGGRIVRLAVGSDADLIGSYAVAGAKGGLEANPGYLSDMPLENGLAIDGGSRASFRSTDRSGANSPMLPIVS